MTEAELQRKVFELCVELGLHHFHERDCPKPNDLSTPGLPDSVIIGTEILFRELKSRDGVLEPAQRRWGSRIERAGGNWAVWRPDDWHNGIIEQQLLEISIYFKCVNAPCSRFPHYYKLGGH